MDQSSPGYLDGLLLRASTSLPQIIYLKISRTTTSRRERLQRETSPPPGSLHRMRHNRLDLPRKMHNDRTTRREMVSPILLWKMLLLPLLHRLLSRVCA